MTQEYPKDMNLQAFVDFTDSIKKSFQSSKDSEVAKSDFRRLIENNDTLKTLTRMLYSLPYMHNLTINSGTRRPDGFRESNRENEISEDEYVYDIIELMELMHSGEVDEIDRYLLVKRYMKANFENMNHFYKLIKKEGYGGIPLDFVEECIGGVERIAYRPKMDLCSDVLEKVDLAGYYMIPNPGKENGKAVRLWLTFNAYGELNFIGENDRMCYSCWSVLNDIAYSFKDNRIRNMVIEGTMYVPDENGNEDQNSKPMFFWPHHCVSGPLKFSMYDMYTIDEFFNGKCDRPYLQRYEALKDKMSEAVDPRGNWCVPEISAVESNESLLRHLATGSYDCDGYFFMSPNPIDHDKIQEYSVTKNVASVHIDSAETRNGTLYAKLSGYDGEYGTLLDLTEPASKSYMEARPSFLINKDVDVVYLKKYTIKEKNKRKVILDTPILQKN